MTMFKLIVIGLLLGFLASSVPSADARCHGKGRFFQRRASCGQSVQRERHRIVQRGSCATCQ